MLSRTLGPEFGGSVGTLFYFANVVSCALYLAACTEGLVNNFGPNGSVWPDWLLSGYWWNFAYATILNGFNLMICLVGAKWFGRTTAAILACVMACTMVTIGSFFQPHEMTFTFEEETCKLVKTSNQSLVENCSQILTNGTFAGLSIISHQEMQSLFLSHLYPRYSRDCSDPSVEVNFFIVFGVLFSGITGIMSGANMSGELVSPAKSIPKGTLWACLFTLSTLISLSFLTALTCDSDLLLHDCNYMSTVSVWPPMVAIGTLLATFSASLNNMIGASRVLEAVAKDVLFGPFLSFVSRGVVKDNPIAAVMTTWCFVQLFLLMGSLNKIAQLSSVLFLLSYASY